MEQSKPLVKIFIAYPGDCKASRQAIVDIIDHPDYRWRQVFDIRLVYWENPDQPMLGDWNLPPQSSVVQHVGDPADCDLMLTLFAHRIGSPLPEAKFGRDEDDQLWTGTVWELAQASAAGKDCWVFRDKSPMQIPDSASDEEFDQLHAQAKAVRQFFTKRVKDEDGAYCRSVDEHTGAEAVAEIVGDKLRRWFENRLTASNNAPTPTIASAAVATSLNSAQQELLHRIIADDQLDYAALTLQERQRYDALLVEVRNSPVNCLQSFLLRRYAEWADGEGGRLQSRFVKLDLQIHRGAGSETGFYEQRGQTHDSLAGLLAANGDVRGLVLVGDPGCGKSTILQHHELHSAASALRALNDDSDQTTVLEVCLWHRLSGFATDDSPESWLQAQRSDALNALLQRLLQTDQRVKLRYLLDGVNEIRVATDRQYRDSLRQWSAWAAQAEGRGDLAPIFSVRRRNLSTALTSGELQIHQISVQRWSPVEIKQYIEHRFGSDTDAANTLWQQIDDDPRLREQCSLPLDLKQQCDVFAALGRPADTRAELFGALCWRRLLELHSKEALDDLLHDSDIKALDSEHLWKRRLLNLPDRGELLQTLYREAAAMHTDGVQVERDEDTLAQHLNDSHQWCEWMLKLPFLEQVSDENPALRFIHQNWQEYFAGCALAQMEPAQWPDFAADAPDPLEQVRAELGNLDPLPGAPVSHWDEAAKFAIQLAEGEQRGALLQQLQLQNPALAGRATALLPVQDGKTPSPAADWIDQLRQTLLQRSRDPSLHLRLRIESAEALGELGDPRYERCTSDEGIDYIIPRDDYWIDFAAGDYTVGSEDGDDDERPPVQVTLDSFTVAFATVTNAEYRCFVDSDGYRDSRWWPGVAGEWVSGEWRDQGLIDEWQERLIAVREIIQKYDGAQDRIDAVMALNLFSNLTAASAENWINNGSVDSTVADEWLEEQFGTGDPKTEPELWRNSQFNQRAQPVVGMSVFEAEAYCRWIAHQSSRPLCLPSEAHWEAAARGKSARQWPFVLDGDLTGEHVNHEATHLHRAAPVGCFPLGDSGEGLLDICGNVWEWTATPWSSQLSAAAVVERAGVKDNGPRGLRGGSFNSQAFHCRPSYRHDYSPGNRSNNSGFRLFSCPIHEH